MRKTKYDRINELLNAYKECFIKYEDFVGFEDEDGNQCFHNNVYIKTELIDKHNQVINNLCKFYRQELLSDDYISNYLFKMVVLMENLDAKTFEDELSNLEDKEFTHIRPIYGASLKTDIVEKYSWKFIRSNKLNDYLPKDIIEKFETKNLGSNGCYALIKIKAKDYNYSLGIANSKFKELKVVLNFINGKQKDALICSTGGKTEGYYNYVLEEGETALIHSIDDKRLSIQLDCEKFFGSNQSSYVWRLFNESNQSEMQVRIINALLWVGDSIIESDSSISFIKSMFSIECLLQYNDTILDKSLTAQLSETAALILGKNLEERINIESRVKNYYKLRSKIAHGNKLSKDEEELTLEVIDLSKELIIKFLVEPRLNTLINKKDLIKYIKELRYS